MGQFEFQIRPVPGLTVIPAEAGIQIPVLDPGLRRGDEIRSFAGSNDLKLAHYPSSPLLDLIKDEIYDNQSEPGRLGPACSRPKP